MASNRKRRDPRTDPAATLEDFVRRINRMGFPNAHRVEFPLWSVQDIRWAACLVEKLYHELKEYGWHSTDLDPLERVLRARMATIGVAHAMRYRTSNLKSRAIVRGLPRIPD